MCWKTLFGHRGLSESPAFRFTLMKDYIPVPLEIIKKLRSLGQILHRTKTDLAFYVIFGQIALHILRYLYILGFHFFSLRDPDEDKSRKGLQMNQVYKYTLLKVSRMTLLRNKLKGIY